MAIDDVDAVSIVAVDKRRGRIDRQTVAGVVRSETIHLYPACDAARRCRLGERGSDKNPPRS